MGLLRLALRPLRACARRLLTVRGRALHGSGGRALHGSAAALATAAAAAVGVAAGGAAAPVRAAAWAARTAARHMWLLDVSLNTWALVWSWRFWWARSGAAASGGGRGGVGRASCSEPCLPRPGRLIYAKATPALCPPRRRQTDAFVLCRALPSRRGDARRTIRIVGRTGRPRAARLARCAARRPWARARHAARPGLAHRHACAPLAAALPAQARLALARAISEADELRRQLDSEKRLQEAQRTYILALGDGGGCGGCCGGDERQDAAPEVPPPRAPGAWRRGGDGRGQFRRRGARVRRPWWGGWQCVRITGRRGAFLASWAPHACPPHSPAPAGPPPRRGGRVRGVLGAPARHCARLRPRHVRAVQRAVRRLPLLQAPRGAPPPAVGVTTRRRPFLHAARLPRPKPVTPRDLCEPRGFDALYAAACLTPPHPWGPSFTPAP
jgi:hypothetical protein